MRRKLNLDENDDVEINLSPMIDMVFILLIFFIVTTVFVEEAGIEVQKPEVESAESLDKNSLIIAIDSNGNVYYGGNQISLGQVRGIVQSALQGDKTLPIDVQCDINASHEMFAKLYDQCVQGGAQAIAFSEYKK
tara:strand:- start:900 stop:1304 length:405 start_codon:yes stop_codon:yes gene_type:complete